jgi:release factor glutamine methyltransferase
VTAAEALRIGTARLREAGIESPRLEARLLLAHTLGVGQAALLGDQQAVIPGAAAAAFAAVIERRTAREPLALITGRREFWSLDFLVSPATLIPRPDSETLIQAAAAAFSGRPPPRRILDLGTGTGCLLLAALQEFPDAFGIGIDIVPAAAALAARNAEKLGLDHRASFICSDWAEALLGRFELVLSNPPYIPTCDLVRLMPDVGRYEPRLALDGGNDGLTAHRRIVAGLPGLLARGGIAVLEAGIDQAARIIALAEDTGFRSQAVSDLGGIPRAIVLEAKAPVTAG